MDFQDLMVKNGDFYGENRGRGGALFNPNELVLIFGGLHLCVQFVENRQRNATVRVTTHRQTDANRFYYLSHAICYSYGADNNINIHEKLQKSIFLAISVILAAVLVCLLTAASFCWS